MAAGMDIRMKKNWIYELRALGIIAVVVCHQYNLLHTSDLVQCLSLYSVTSLIFLMGVTKYYSITGSFKKNKNFTWFSYTTKSLMSVMLPYTFVSYLGISILNKSAIDLPTLWQSLICFNAFSPFYFVKYIFIFTIMAPVLYLAVLIVCKKDIIHIILTMIFIVLLWVIGYYTTDNVNTFGSTYLPVYGAGLVVGKISCEEKRNAKSDSKYYVLWFMACLFLAASFILLKDFYMNNAAGDFRYFNINTICPKVSINPPNLSVIIYSAGVMGLFYFVFTFINSRDAIFFRTVQRIFVLIGKDSMDIFLWHIFMQHVLVGRGYLFISNVVFRYVVFYFGMIFVPIIVRELYNRLKSKGYAYLAEKHISEENE